MQFCMALSLKTENSDIFYAFSDQAHLNTNFNTESNKDFIFSLGIFK